MVVGARQADLSSSQTAEGLCGFWGFVRFVQFLGFAEDGPKKENIQWAAVVWRKVSC